MKLFIDNKELNIPESELSLRYLGEGSESTVYRYKDEALKIHKDNFYQKRLTEEAAIKMSKISTKRILLPRKIIYDENGEYIGYTTPYQREYNKDLLKRITMEKFIEELKILREDTRIISNEGIMLEDVHQNNLLVGDGLYLCDPGLYKFTDINYEDLYSNNIIELNYLFTVLLLETRVFDLTNKQADKLEDYFGATSRFFLEKLIEEQDINPKQKVNPFMKKLALSMM